ncbi:MAG: ABC transporter substrate-binding protein [Nitriliruptoraceae bacterium]
MFHSLRRTAFLASWAVIVVACSPASAPESFEEPPGVIGEVPQESVEGTQRVASYEVGIFEEPKSDNWWAYLSDSDVWSGYVLMGTACQLYALSPPSFAVTPQLAGEALPDVESDGDEWFVEVSLHRDVTWSDGHPITAHDVAFTWRTVNELELGGQWLTAYQPESAGVGSTRSVQAIDDHTVRITFASEPGLGTWPMALGLASIMPEHHWGPIVEAADDAADLLGTDGAGSPSCGPYVYSGKEPGAFARVVANDRWFLAGTAFTHYADGSVRMVNPSLGLDERFGVGSGDDEVVADYVTGPHADEIIYLLYGNASVGVTALAEGEIAWLLAGPGLEAAAQDRLFDADDVEVVVNPNYSLQFLGFNLEREPMGDLAFREAVATVIDREHLTRRVMGGAAFPLYTRMPSGNAAWHDGQAAAAIEQRWSGFATQADRVQAAVAILADAGYVWVTEPEVNPDTGDVVVRGEGLTTPDGRLVPRLEIIHPTAGYDALRNTAGLVVTQAMRDLGIDVVSVPMEFGQLVSMVIDPSNLQYDMAVLGWGLGNPALPTYYDAFWRSDGALNITGYSDDEFDAAVARFMAATDLAEARQILWSELEPILDRDLPYVPIFDTSRVDGYQPSMIDFGFTRVLGGLSRVDGIRETVIAPE